MLLVECKFTVHRSMYAVVVVPCPLVFPLKTTFVAHWNIIAHTRNNSNFSLKL